MDILVKAICNLLMFDKPDTLGNLFPKDCKIEIPEKIPVTHDFKFYEPAIGFASVTREKDRLVAEIEFNSQDTDVIKECICNGDIYAGGYYNQVKSHKENGIRVVESMRLLCLSPTYADVYGDKSLLIRLKNDEKIIKPCPFCGSSDVAIKTKERLDGNCHFNVKYVACANCGARTMERTCDGYYGDYCSDEEIAAMWNQRVTDNASLYR